MGIFEEAIVDKGSVGRLVLDHDSAVLVDEYAKMDVADPPQWIIGEDDVASTRVPPKDEAGRRAVNLARQPQDNGVVAMICWVGFELTRSVLVLIIEFYVVSFVPADEVRRLGLEQLLDLDPRSVRVRVQHADDV